MASLNKVVFIGNMVADPELKQTASGKSVANFSIAINRSFVSEEAKKAGAVDVDFFNVVVWGKQADFVCTYFSKGEPIFVLGQLQNRKWTDNDGGTHYATEVIADEVSFVRSKENGEQKQNFGA